MSNTTKIIAIGLGTLVLVVVVAAITFWVKLDALFGGAGKNYSASEVAIAFNDKKAQVESLIAYFNSIVPKGKTVEIEFMDDHQLNRFGFAPRDTNNIGWFVDWNLDIEGDRMDSINKVLGWNRETLRTLKAKLDTADCIQIKNGYPTQIGFKRSSMHMYFFNVFDPPLPVDQQAKYNDGCQYRLINDRLAVEFGSGVLGSQCWPEFFKEGKSFPPAAPPVTVQFDTLKLGQGPAQQSFIPLLAFLQDASFSADYVKLINTGLEEHSVPMDSVWIEPRQWKNETGKLAFGLYFRSGIVEEIELEKSGQLREGNWSGKDGTLTIDKTTGKSTYLLWQ